MARVTGGRLVVASTADARLAVVREWLLRVTETGTVAEMLVIGESLDGPHAAMLDGVESLGPVAGWRRATLPLLARELAGARLADAGQAPASALARDAIVARAIEGIGPEKLGRLADVADTPGFVRAVARALDDLRLAGVKVAELARYDQELATIARAAEAEWSSAGLADYARVLSLATETAFDPEVGHFWLDLPTVWLDVRVHTEREGDLLRALTERARAWLVTIPAGDDRTLAILARRGLTAHGADTGENALTGLPREARASGGADREATALARLGRRLFLAEDEAPAEGAADETVTIFSAPGEGRECVEIVRRLLAFAEGGVPFDRMAILLRQPEDYRPHLEEALGRADIPAYFARGVRHPDPAGRAFLALLRCRAEDFSALRFAEYLSIGQVPDADPAGAPPTARAEPERWEPADEPDVEAGPWIEARARGVEMAPRLEAGGGGVGTAPPDGEPAPPDGEPAPPDGEPKGDGPVRAGTLRVPRRWERLLVDASVVGGLDRWRRRLDGLEAEIELRLAGLEAEEADQPQEHRLRRDLADLGHLRAYALPLLAELSGLPSAAPWGEWLDRLGALATRAIRHPARILSTLTELSPLRPVGPVGLDEVLRVLSPRLLEVTERPEGNRYGRVFVAPIEEARGLSFDVAFVPGLAERVFPPKISEDPILLDEVRECLNEDLGNGGGVTARPLVTNEDRVAAERLALRLAIGAARERVVLSYPRIEAIKARPRVPSFYALEAVRAAEGSLPQFEELGKRAEEVADARIGWPAPDDAGRAIDEAEYDLAVLDDLGLRGEPAVRAAGYLLNSNPHLARALRFRAYRWGVSKWTKADGLVNPSGRAREALARHAPDARAYSATALQHFAACPYRFFLYAIHRLEPREEPVGIEELDPLERGSLVHQVQFELFGRLGAESSVERPLLPVRRENLERALEILDEVLDAVAEDFAERLVPAIERVWLDGIASIRQDLREWLHRESRSESPFAPWRFELSFGLPRDPDRDPHSVSDPVDLGNGLRLRGAIDLVERTPSGVLRVTDHKTGRARAKKDAVVQGGEILQPVLYGLATRALFPDASVESGRLYYCTSRGGFEQHEVRLDEEAEDAARVVGEVVRSSFEEGMLPAVPRRDACRWCDYLTVCGPDEERRIRRKPRLGPLERLRDLR